MTCQCNGPGKCILLANLFPNGTSASDYQRCKDGFCDAFVQSDAAVVRARKNGPGLIQKTVNFTKAVVTHTVDMGRQATEEEYQERRAGCNNCPGGFFDKAADKCLHKRCGCGLEVKLRWASEQCPLEPPVWRKL